MPGASRSSSSSAEEASSSSGRAGPTREERRDEPLPDGGSAADTGRAGGTGNAGPEEGAPRRNEPKLKERPSMVKTKEKGTHNVTSPAGGDPRKDRDPEKAVRVKERKERRDPVGEKWKTGFAEKSARISKQSCGRQSHWR